MLARMPNIVNLPTGETAPTGEPYLDPYEGLKNLVGDEMMRVSQLINEKMCSDENMIPDIGTHITKAGGKRLRPMLTLASAHLCDYQGRDHIALAAAVELMHTATLLHDDVVDESDRRRSVETARLKWGNAASVLVGDFMLGQAFKLMVGTGSLTALDVLSQAATIIAEGEIMQLASLHDINVAEDYYIKVVNAKTAALFAAAAEVGAVIAAQDKSSREALATFGRSLGIAFQLVDDALDYSPASQTGKNIGDDFRESKMTLPVSIAYQAGDEAERAFWHRTIRQCQQEAGDFEQAMALVDKHNALTLTLEQARHYGEMARHSLAIFPDNEYRRAMLGIVAFCVRRTF